MDERLSANWQLLLVSTFLTSELKHLCTFLLKAPAFSVTRPGINRTFENDLVCPLCEASEGNMARFTSLVGSIAWRLELPSPQLVSL